VKSSNTTSSSPGVAAPTDAVDFHSDKAQAFEGRYAHDRRFQSRHSAWNELIDAYSGPAKEVLDVGCGSGALSVLAASRNRQVLGIDGSEAMIRLAREKCAREGVANATFAVGRIEALATLVTEPCDLLLCSSVLEYLEDLESALSSLTAVVRPGGIAILSMPNRQSLFAASNRPCSASRAGRKTFRTCAMC
jgi:2-polyprenyl-6-hydroxyphenyl methylase/3-demethylubiquinone-9 3-methyltransferase